MLFISFWDPACINAFQAPRKESNLLRGKVTRPNMKFFKFFLLFFWLFLLCDLCNQLVNGETEGQEA